MAGEQSHIAAQLLLAATSAAQPAHRSADPEQPNAPVSDQDSSELHESSAAWPASSTHSDGHLVIDDNVTQPVWAGRCDGHYIFL